MRYLFSLPLALIASAADIAIVNAGFEDISGETSQNEFTFGDFPGWSFYDPIPDTKGDGTGGTFFIGTLRPTIIKSVHSENHQYFPDGAPEGSRVGIAFNFNNGGNEGEYGLRQVLSATLQANTRYTLGALVGNIASGTSVNASTFDLDGFPGYRVDLLAGDTLLASGNNSLTGSIDEGAFAQSTTVYDSPSFGLLIGQQLSIRLVNLNVIDPSFTSSDLEVDFDDITLTAIAIPEPAAASLLMAVVALAATQRRRRA